MLPFEPYVKAKGKWTYLYRAIDKRGNTIDLYLFSTRNTKAVKHLNAWIYGQGLTGEIRFIERLFGIYIT